MKTLPPRVNYQHLMYFWSVVRNGSLYKACEELHLAAPTVSAQLRTLEERLGVKLLDKSGRRLVPTEMGKLVFTYADEIFSLGADMLSALAQKPTRKPMRVAIGVDDVVPKAIAHRLIGVAMTLPQPVRLVCKEGTFEQLLNALQMRELDVILTDVPVTPSLNLRAYNHHLGDCDAVWMATGNLTKTLRAGFPKSLNGAPILLPTADTAIRRSLDQWLDRNDIQPVIVGEFEDYALLWEFARSGRGVAPVPVVLAREFTKNSALKSLGVAKNVRAQFYAISMERKIVHPVVNAIYEQARKVFGG
ncbi:MAG TPA: transcriptional activator NhaR [Steroidobacteraceae bacterium]|jgi:LysR family transcriptional activator of nhaA|nr:transcriptional activator NhaR [Steroidobacteraceae bacterium]